MPPLTLRWGDAVCAEREASLGNHSGPGHSYTSLEASFFPSSFNSFLLGCCQEQTIVACSSTSTTGWERTKQKGEMPLMGSRPGRDAKPAPLSCCRHETNALLHLQLQTEKANSTVRQPHCLSPRLPLSVILFWLWVTPAGAQG